MKLDGIRSPEGFVRETATGDRFRPPPSGQRYEWTRPWGATPAIRGTWPRFRPLPRDRFELGKLKDRPGLPDGRGPFREPALSASWRRVSIPSVTLRRVCADRALRSRLFPWRSQRALTHSPQREIRSHRAPASSLPKVRKHITPKDGHVHRASRRRTAQRVAPHHSNARNQWNIRR